LKKFLAVFLIISMLVGMVPVGAVDNLPVEPESIVSTANDPLIRDNGEINTARLKKIGTYSELATQEKNVVLDHYSVTDAEMTACQNLGYDILDSIRIIKAASAVDVTPAQYKQYADVYGDEESASQELAQYKTQKDLFDPAEQNLILAAMSTGKSFFEATFEMIDAQAEPRTVTETPAVEPPTTMERDFVTAPVEYYAEKNELVNASTGEFSYRQTLVDLKGKNGLDLKLDLVFSGNTNLYYGYLFPNNDESARWTDWYYKPANGTQLKVQADSPYGVGWSMDLPMISTTYEDADDSQKVIRYHMQGGSAYEIIEENGVCTLKDYHKGDITVTKCDETYAYKITHADGRYEYFDLDGRLRVLGNRWINEEAEEDEKHEIKFYYCITENDKSVPFDLDDDVTLSAKRGFSAGGIKRIVDSAGRIIQFQYARDLENRWGGVWITLTDLEEEYSLAELNQNPLSPNGVFVTGAIETNGIAQGHSYIETQSVNFEYETSELPCVDEPLDEGKTLESNGTYNTLLNMYEIKYESGLKSWYNYNTCTVNNGQGGCKKILRVANRYESDPAKQGNGLDGLAELRKIYYSYDGDYSGYSGGYSDQNDLPETYTYTVTRIENRMTTETTYNHKHLPVLECVTAQGKTRTVETTYNDRDLVSEVCTTIGETEAVERYEYDEKGNVTKHWNSRGEDSLTETVYDTRFNLPLTRTYKTDAQHTVVEEYSLSEDGKCIREKRVKENGVLKERIAYLYDIDNADDTDDYGNVTEERRYVNGTEYLETTYDYTDWNADERPEKWDFKGLYLTMIWGIGGRDIDGTSRSTVSEAVYDSIGRKIKEYDAYLNETLYEYDGSNRIKKITNPDGTTQTFSYFRTNTANITVHTDEMGTETEYHYDAAGNLTEIRDAASGETLKWYRYDEYYRLIQEGNARLSTTGQIITYTYDGFDRVTSKTTTDVLGEVLARETWGYDDAEEDVYFVTTHTVVGDTDAPSIVTKEYRNKHGDLEKVGYVTGENEYYTTYTYDLMGRKLTEKSALADQKNWTVEYTTRWEYDYAGRVLREYDADGKYISHEYDMAGRLVKSADRVSNAQSVPYYTTYEYDGYGNVQVKTVPQTESQSRITKYLYDDMGRVLEERVLCDVVDGIEQYRTTEYDYDWRGNVIAMTLGDVTTTYNYDALGRVISSTVGDKTTEYTYDRFGNCLSESSYGQTESNTYDINGVLVKHVDKGGIWNTYKNDGMGRVVETKAPGEPTRFVKYTMTGAISEISDTGVNSNNKIVRKYNDRGQMTYDRSESPVEKYYTYDIAGNRESMQLRLHNSAIPEIQYTYWYDILGRLGQVYEGSDNAPLIGYIYDENGNVVLELNDVMVSTYEYNRDNSVSMNDDENLNSEQAELKTTTYTYYPDGNVKTEAYDGDVTTYTYDARNQLIGETNSGRTVSYTYDANGNRTQKTTVANGVTDVVNYTYAYGKLMTAESSQNGTTYYGYDGSGYLVVRATDTQVDTFAYDHYGQLAVARIDDVTTTYDYRPDGLRRSKTTNGVITRHVYDGDQIIAELNQNYYRTQAYHRGLRLAKFEGENAVAYYYDLDAHGDVVRMVSDSGFEISASYDAYGNSDSNNHFLFIGNPFEYCGEYCDFETGFLYLRARYYDPTTGRFTSVDPVKDGLNWYVYCNNNPVRYVDRTGTIPVETIIDFASIGWSYYDLVQNPSWLNFGYLLLDVVAAAIPYLPGSYSLKTVKAGTKIISRADEYVKTGVWAMDQWSRGWEIERALGGMANNFPTIDKFISSGVKNGDTILTSVTSIKSIDITADTYKKAGGLRHKLKSYVNSLIEFKEKTYKGVTYVLEKNAKKILEVAIPPVSMSAAQAAVFEEIQSYAAENGIEFIVRIIS